MGSGGIADADNTIALGNQSLAVAAGAIAIGQGNKADGANAIALGNGSVTGGANAIALGQGSYAGLENGIAIGGQASAQGTNSVALGAGSVATEDNSISVGNTTDQRKIVNMAAGDISTSSTDAINGSQLYAISKSVADRLGGGATVNAQGVVTAPNYRLKNGIYGNVGDALADLNNNTIQWDSVKKGYSAAHGTDATSTITNVKAGTISATSTDAVNGSQLNATNMMIEQNSQIINQLAGNTDATYIEENGAGINYVRTNDNGLAFNDASASGVGATAVGYNAVASGASSVAIGQNSNSTVDTGIALGSSSVSSRVIAKGSRDTSVTENGVVIGYDTTDGELLGALSIGNDGKYRQIINVADGSEAHDAVTVRSQTTRGAQTGYTAYNMDAPQNSVGEFSVGSEDGQRQITNVAAGSADTDAVNVGQLKVTDAQVSQNTQSITNLNNQVTNLDTRVTNIENGIGDIVTTGSTKYFKTNTDGVDASAQGKDSVAIGSGSIAAADNSVALGTGSVATEENTISVGSSTNQRRITNVAAGKNDTDAVNVAQLKSSEAGGVRYDTNADGSVDYSNITLGGGNGSTTRISNVSAGVNNNDAVNYAQLKQSVQETKQYTDQRMVEMDNKLSKTESKLSGGIASAMAMTGLPQAYTPGASMASIGGGTYNGESAVALGVSMVSANGRWVYKLQGSTNSQGEYSAALGAGIQW